MAITHLAPTHHAMKSLQKPTEKSTDFLIHGADNQTEKQKQHIDFKEINIVGTIIAIPTRNLTNWRISK
jgi:hypothetical protein